MKRKNKIYDNNNKEIMNEKQKMYYENNKGKILKKGKEKFECECGCVINKRQLSRHQKNKKHLDLILNVI